MCQALSYRTLKARKRYNCGCAEDIRETYPCTRMIEEELAVVKDYLDKGCMIEPGDLYENQFVVDGGDNWTWRGRKDIVELCRKYELFNYD
jgi:hypothetical protein